LMVLVLSLQSGLKMVNGLFAGPKAQSGNK
jgi:hypothetical protein